MGRGDYHNMHGGVSGGGNDAHSNIHFSQGWYGGGTGGKADGVYAQGNSGWGNAAAAAALIGRSDMHEGVSGGVNGAHSNLHFSQGWNGGDK
eukprot:6490213-Ditylum_brightwellii.AAC.1